MVESSRSIAAAVMTTPKAIHRHFRPVDPVDPAGPGDADLASASAPARCSIVPVRRGPEPGPDAGPCPEARAGLGPDAGPGPCWVLMTSDPPVLSEQNLLFQY